MFVQLRSPINAFFIKKDNRWFQDQYCTSDIDAKYTRHRITFQVNLLHYHDYVPSKSLLNKNALVSLSLSDTKTRNWAVKYSL